MTGKHPMRWVIAAVMAMVSVTFTLGAVEVNAASGAVDGFDQYRDSLARAFKSGDVDAILDLLETGTSFDNVTLAKMLVGYGLQHENLLVHRGSIDLLSRAKNPEARQYLNEQAVKHKRWEKRAHCCRVISRFGGELAFGNLCKILEKEKKWQVRSAAIRSLVRFRRVATIDALIPRLRVEKGRLLSDLRWTLSRLTGMTHDPVFEDWSLWWKTKRDGYEVPRAAEVRDMLGGEKEKKQNLKTAVREGLYGPIYSEKVAFLLDTSGSMLAGTEEGTRMEIAIRELSRVLENQMTDDTYFNVMPFSKDVYPFSSKLQRAKRKSLEVALKKLPKLEAAGETNAYAALKAAFDDPDVDTIYVLSDGSPTIGDEHIPDLIRLRVEEWNRDRRVIINCIGFFPGEAKNQDKESARDFLRQLASDNEGFYKEIY